MRRALLVLCACTMVTLAPAPAFAWGTAAHRYIMRRAIDLLPPSIKPFFDHFRDELVLRVTDPDLWRNVGWEDDPNHFLDLGVPEFGPYPFAALPREYGAAIEKFGMATLKREGLLPWREQEEAGNLRRAMEGFTRNAIYSASDTVLFTAVAAHYLQDATQPLHATNNYDGQMTGQAGIHSRFEATLFERVQSNLVITPAAPAPMASARDAAFDALLVSNQLVPALLEADKAAAAGKDTYDDGYYEKLFAATRTLMERQIGAAITATASLIEGAWEQAGRPELKTEIVRPPQKIRPRR